MPIVQVKVPSLGEYDCLANVHTSNSDVVGIQIHLPMLKTHFSCEKTSSTLQTSLDTCHHSFGYSLISHQCMCFPITYKLQEGKNDVFLGPTLGKS